MISLPETIRLPLVRVRWILIGGTALVMVGFILSGRLMTLTALVAFAVFAVASYYRPMPAVLLTLLISTNFVKFLDVAYLPYVQLGQGARLNAEDLVVTMLLGIGILRLRQRRERPIFLAPLLFLGVIVLASYLLGMVAGTTNLSAGLNQLRNLSGYVFYVAFVGVVDSPRRFRVIVWSLFALAAVTVSLQVVEASLGQRLALPTSVSDEYYSQTVVIDVAGQTVPYLWNRASGYLFVAFFLAVGGLLWRWNLRDAVLVTLGLLGFVIALIRQWYIVVALGLLTVILLPRKGRWRAALALSGAFLAFAAVLAIVSASGLTSSYGLADVWLGRLSTIAEFQQQDNFVGRVDIWQGALGLFAQAPLFGYGPGALDYLQANRGLGSYGDVGLPNTLLQFGLFGFGAVVGVIVAFFRRAYALYRRLAGTPRQGYVAGLLGAWVGCLAGYSFGLDFFSAGGQGVELTFAVGMILALVDRLNAFGRLGANRA